MRIQHNVVALNAYRNYNNNSTTVSKNLEKLSSGYRINRAGDDAAGLAISEKMRAEITALKVDKKNASDAIGMIQTAEGALTEVHSMLNRMVELAEQKANGLYTQTDVDALNAEHAALVKEIDRISSNAKYNNLTLLDGTLATKTLQIGGSMALSDLTTTIDANNLGVSSTSVSVSGIKEAIKTVSTFRAKLGAYQNRLEHTIANLAVMHENMTSAESSVRDTDVADEMMQYTKNNIMIQAAQAMMAQANQQPQGVLQLLQ